MSHLGDLVSALVDGELSGAELDRANTHLARCALCQAEAAQLRELKRELRVLAAAVEFPDEFARQLLAMDGLRPAGRLAGSRRLPWKRAGRTGRRRARAVRRRLASLSVPPPRFAGPARRHGRYVLWSVVSIIVVGIGVAAFGMGGGSTNGRQITPKQLEVFDMQHAITAGEIPFADPSQVPVKTAKP